MRTAKLLRSRILAPGVRELTFDPGPDFEFEAGQWISCRIPATYGEDLARSYSLASAPRADGTFDLAVTRVDATTIGNGRVGPITRKLMKAFHEFIRVKQPQYDVSE